MAISIRKATLLDVDVLNDFLQKLIAVERPMDPSLEQHEKIVYYDIAQFITSDIAELFVAIDNEEIVASGYGLLRDNKPHFSHKKHGYVGFMFVRESHRGNGISHMILEAIFSWFRSKGITETRLQVYHDNSNAIKAYEKAGFKKNLIEMLYYLD